MTEQIYLSPPHMSGEERELLAQAFDSNWIAPLGPMVDAFEQEFCEATGSAHALALSSGTAAIHLALLTLGVQPGDEVFVSSFTFSASVNPIRYVGAIPVLIDSDAASWNMDPHLLAEALESRAKQNRLPAAVIVVDLYGQTADMDAIVALCERYNVNLIEDAAEALGATHGNKAAGTFGRLGIFSFNGNKIITTSGGGMLVSSEEALLQHARKLSTQAREPFAHYQHTEIGYNYRLSNLLAAVGRGQLRVLRDRVAARRRNFEHYRDEFADLPEISFMPEAGWGKSNRWLTCVLLSEASAVGPEQVIAALAERNIEARPLWKPMHLQPIFSECDVFGGGLSASLFEKGLCLPSGSSLTSTDLDRVSEIVREVVQGAGEPSSRTVFV